MNIDKLYDAERLYQRANALMMNISHPKYTFEAAYRGDDEVVIRVACNGTDNASGEALSWKGRKWLLSPHMTDGEIVQTAFLAAKTADEHELREQFKFCNASIFDPHFDVYRLVAFRAGDVIKEREAA